MFAPPQTGSNKPGPIVRGNWLLTFHAIPEDKHNSVRVLGRNTRNKNVAINTTIFAHEIATFDPDLFYYGARLS